MRKLSMDELGRKSVTEFRSAAKTPVVIVLDNIRSMHNVGSVFRTADAFLMEAIILCGYTPQPPHRDIQKTALGATDTVDWFTAATAVEAVIALKTKGYKVYGVEQTDNSISLEAFDFNAADKMAIVLGNEVDGVNSDVLQIVDATIEIPQYGMKHSLNISVAAGIVMWEVMRLRHNIHQ